MYDINREKVFMDPRRITMVTEYIMNHFDQKTYRNQQTYSYNVVQNVKEVATAKDRDKIEEIKAKQRLNGFNSIFAVSSIEMAKLYYNEFKKQNAANSSKALKFGLIYSYGSNEEESDGILDEENSDDTISLDQPSRDFLESAINDYNQMFKTSYDTSSDKFQNYYKDVSLRMKNRELDLLIVVNMFLTGFDATTLNTLWVDKNLKMHGLIQAFSRTNRILNSIKTFGNVVCFRNLQKHTDDALSIFGDKDASGIVLLKPFQDYFYGYVDSKGNKKPGYVDIINELKARFPVSEQIIGEKNKIDFVKLFGVVLRMRNLLQSFDDFIGKEMISEFDFQNYCGMYLDIKDEIQPHKHEVESINDDVVFEIELLRSIDINIDYILMLVQKYHDTHCNDKEILVNIQKAIDASPELRSKKKLIENFINNINDVDDVMAEWRSFLAEEKEKELMEIITSENLKEEETRKFIEDCFKNGKVKTTGTDIDKILPPIRLFGGGNRQEKKQIVIEKITVFFDHFYGLI